MFNCLGGIQVGLLEKILRSKILFFRQHQRPTWPQPLLKLYYYNYVVCILFRNTHKMSRLAALNVCTQSEPVLCAFLKIKQTTNNTTTLNP